jgi:hypothetical protein
VQDGKFGFSIIAQGGRTFVFKSKDADKAADFTKVLGMLVCSMRK